MSSVVWRCAAYAGPAARTRLRELFHTGYNQQNSQHTALTAAEKVPPVEMPEWMALLHRAVRSLEVPRYIRLFLTKVRRTLHLQALCRPRHRYAHTSCQSLSASTCLLVASFCSTGAMQRVWSFCPCC